MAHIEPLYVAHTEPGEIPDIPAPLPDPVPDPVPVYSDPGTITVTAPTGTAQVVAGELLTVSWTTETPIEVGQFGVWVINSAQAWIQGGSLIEVNPDSLTYSVSFPAEYLVAAGYTVNVWYREHLSDPWGGPNFDIYGASTGTLEVVDAEVPFVPNNIYVPVGATKEIVDSRLAQAKTLANNTCVVFPAGIINYSGRIVVPDRVNILGQGIYDQGVSGGGGGTWLKATGGMKWGSHITVENMLIGANTAGLTVYYCPIARGATDAGGDTNANGSHNVTFNFCRFKGGSDTGARLFDLGSNFGSGLWSAAVKTIDMVATTWNDCEFERVQSTNAINGTGLGTIVNFWYDCRAGGAQLHDIAWNRCHFGVKNGYHTGTDGYGCGAIIIFQPSPAEHAPDGARPTTGGVGDYVNGWNPNFDWGLVDHPAYNISFTDCLMEYASNYPMNPCDYARSYSVWHGNYSGRPGTLTTALSSAANRETGWGNPPGSHWTDIPDEMWLENFDLMRCYLKGSSPVGRSIVYELCRHAASVDSYCGTGGTGANTAFGNTLSGSFSNANRPNTALFPTDWSGVTTSYTDSPYDPA